MGNSGGENHFGKLEMILANHHIYVQLLPDRLGQPLPPLPFWMFPFDRRQNIAILTMPIPEGIEFLQDMPFYTIITSNFVNPYISRANLFHLRKGFGDLRYGPDRVGIEYHNIPVGIQWVRINKYKAHILIIKTFSIGQNDTIFDLNR